MKCPECGADTDRAAEKCPSCGMNFAGIKAEDTSDFVQDTTAVNLKYSEEPAAPPKSIDKYEIIRELGKGAMGRVYLARDTVLNREVAVKTMVAGEDATEAAIARFISEAKSAGKLRHPGIVAVHEVGQKRSLYYMVMDYIEGRTLKELSREDSLRWFRIAEIIRDTAAALHYAHGQGIIHRDIKPANIIIRNDGSAHLMDFGLARNLDEEHSLTRSGDIMGTPAYINPEQALGRAKQVDARSDVYSLGAVMYELLTGNPPALGANMMEIIAQVADEDPVKPRRINRSVPRDLEIICRKAMFKEPERRYQTAEALAEDLQRFLDREPIRARPVSPLYALGKKFNKYRKPIEVAALVLALIGSGTFLYIEKERADTALKVAEAAQQQAGAERAKVRAEQKRLRAEREQAEAEQAKLEATRREAQAKQEMAEAAAVEAAAQQAQAKAEKAAAEEERKRLVAEREAAEARKRQEEAERKSREAEQAKAAAEKAKAEAEKRRIAAEKARAEADKKRVQAEKGQSAAEKKKAAAERELKGLKDEKKRLERSIAEIEKKKADVEQKRVEAIRELNERKEKEKRDWVPVYRQNFDKLEKLGPEWDTTQAGVVKDKALFIDGNAGGTIVWLKIPLTDKNWQCEYDGWAGPGAKKLNDIGLIVKGHKDAPDYRSGFEVQFGGRDNKTSGILFKGEDIYVTKRENTIKAGHRYHFLVNYRGGTLRFKAVDTTAKETIINKIAEVPDINITMEDQRQGFWTWGSQIYIDNIVISKLGLAEARSYADVAREFQELVGTGAAFDYLRKELDTRETAGDKADCYNTMLKMCLNTSQEEKEKFKAQVIGVFLKTFPRGNPSQVLEKDLVAGFFDLCRTIAKEDGIDPVKLMERLKMDPEFKPE